MGSSPSAPAIAFLVKAAYFLGPKMIQAMTRNDKTKTAAKASEAPAPKKKRANPLQFLAQVRQEARKVTWTSQKETMISTVMVLIMVAFATLFFFLVDLAISVGIA